MTGKVLRAWVLTAGLALGGCATQAVRDCQTSVLLADPDESVTTQGHDRAQALMADCMKTRGYLFDWNVRACDRAFPTTVTKGRCYRREPDGA